MDLSLERFEEDDEILKLMRGCASDAFRILRVLPLSDDPMCASYQLLRMTSIAVLGDCGSDVMRILRKNTWQDVPLDHDDWGRFIWSIIIDVWLRLIQKKGGKTEILFFSGS